MLHTVFWSARQIAGLCLLVALAGCGSVAGSGTQSPHSGPIAVSTRNTQTPHGDSTIDRAVTPVVLRDPAPDQLDVLVSITMGGYTADSRDLATIAVGFTSSGVPVQFEGAPSLTCNGAAIVLAQAVGGIPATPAPTALLVGKAFNCTYRVEQSTTTFTFTVPQAPAILTPLDQAQVPRSTATRISYHIDGGSLTGLVALGPRSKAFVRPDAQDPMPAILDTSGLAAGPGSITLTEALAPQVALTGAPVKSLRVGGTALAVTAVVWM